MPTSQTVFRKSVLTYVIGSALALTLLISFFWYFANRSLPNVNAQIGQVTTVIENASTPITGGWQAGTDNSDPEQYRLWSYKTYGLDEKGSSYPRRVFCYWYRVPVYDTDEDGNKFLVPISDITFGGETYRETQTFNNDEGTSTVENVVGGGVTIEVDGKLRPDLNPYRSDCLALNVDPLKNNLVNRDDYLVHEVPAEAQAYGWMTGTNPVIWPNSQTAILEQKPFLVLGNNATGGGGFTNTSLDLNLWIPDDFDIAALELTTSNLCDNTNWDENGDHAEISVHLKGQAGSVQIIDEDDCAQDTHSLAGINNLSTLIGASFPKRNLTALSDTASEDQLYKHYKIEAKIDLGTNTDQHYINQFSLAVSQPINAYLGIGQTQSDRGGDYISTTALSVSNRLPDPYDRLEVFWQTEIYLAADASKGCSGEETERIGFYDSDYPTEDSVGTEIWGHYVGKNPDMKPEVDIYSADRNKFLNGEIVRIDTPERKLTFDGRQDGADVSQDEWEYEEFTFEYDKIYELRFRNIDQRTWIQIGLPFDQINALQKCVDKPLVKVYQSDVSAGGRFGSGINIRNCRDDDLSLATPAVVGIYAHGQVGLNGSSSEYVVYARGTIDAFYSKFKGNQDPPPDPIQELTFANNDASFAWGGHWGGQQRCMPNYWRQVQHLESPLEEASLNLANLSQNSATYYTPPLPDEILSLSAPGNDLDLKAAVYVEGDLLITSNIINNNANMKKFNEIKSIYLIVQGDIFIDASVTQIDAVLVAMPSDDTHSQEGRIYTCYLDNLSAVDSVNLDSLKELQKKTSTKLKAENIRYAQECVKQLVVNGALIARRIHLGRTTSSDSSSLGYATYPVSEEVYLQPEYLIGAPQLPTYSDWFYKSDSITILPINF